MAVCAASGVLIGVGLGEKAWPRHSSGSRSRALRARTGRGRVSFSRCRRRAGHEAGPVGHITMSARAA